MDYEDKLKVLDYWVRAETVRDRQQEMEENVRESYDERGVAGWTLFDPL